MNIYLVIGLVVLSPVVYVILRILYFTINYFLWKSSYSGMPRLSDPLSSLKVFIVPDFVDVQNRELNKLGGGKMPPIAFIGPSISKGIPVIVVSSPDLLREVADESRFMKLKEFYDPLSVLAGDALVTSTGERWKVHRHVINPLFYNNKLKVFAGAMVENGRRLVEELRRREGEAIDVPGLLGEVTQRILIDSLFSGKIDPVETAALWHEGMSWFNILVLFDLILGSTVNQLLPFRKHVLAARSKLCRVIQPLIDEARREAHLIDEQQKDMIHALVAAVDEERNPIFNDSDIIEESLTMLLAGHDTTKSSISWAIYFLAKYPSEMKKLTDEVKELRGKLPTFDDIPKLRCCRNAFQEALRLRPPIPGLPRCAVQNCELDGFFIPKGSVLWLNFSGVMMDEEVWADPFTYNPDRFNTNESHQARSFVPFSVGERNCIGQKFAIAKGILILACVAQHFSLEMACEKVIATQEGTLTPKGFLCKFIPAKSR